MLRFLLCLVPLLAQGAINGVVETLSGPRLEGELQISGGKLIVIGTNTAPTEIPLQDLKLLRVAQAEPATNTLTILAAPPEHGLLGVYFNTPDCTGDFFKTRYDPTIDFDWGQSAPLPEMNSNGFSVRWLGSLVVSNTEHYTFHTVTDDGVRLWINKRLVIDAWKDEFLNLAGPPLILLGGQTNDLRMEMYDARDRAVARLFWSSPTTPRGIVPAERLIPAGHVTYHSRPHLKPKYPAGLLLVNGSVIPGQIESADRSSVRIAGLNSPISTIQVARLMFKPMTTRMETNLLRGRTGLLLKSGDFVEGNLGTLAAGEIEVRSVVLGSRKVSIAQADAVILREPAPGSAKFEIRTRDDGLYRAMAIRLQNDALIVNDPGLPPTKLAAADIVELRAIENK
jgi:hypothetical protein